MIFVTRKKIMLAENHVMHVLYKKISEDDKIMLCKVLYNEDVHAKKKIML